MPNKQSVCDYENQKQTRTISNNKNTLQRNDNDRYKRTNQPDIFEIVDAFSHYVTIMCAPKNNDTMHSQHYLVHEIWINRRNQIR